MTTRFYAFVRFVGDVVRRILPVYLISSLLITLITILMAGPVPAIEEYRILCTVLLLLFVFVVTLEAVNNLPTRHSAEPSLKMLNDLRSPSRTPSVAKRLKQAGWHSERDASERLILPPDLRVFDVADDLLSSFGGLRLGYHSTPFVVDPAAALSQDPDALKLCEAALNRPLYPLGYTEESYPQIVLVDEDGAIYLNCEWDLWLLSKSFNGALAYLTCIGTHHASNLHAQLAHWVICTDGAANSPD